MKFAGLQSIDTGQDVGVPVDWVDAVAFSGGNEGEMNGDGFCTVIGASEEAVLPHQDPAFDGPFRLVVVYRNGGVFEESGKSKPVIQSIVDCLVQLVSGMQLGFCAHNDLAQKPHQRLRFSAPHAQSECWRFVLNLLFDFIQLSVGIEDSIADSCVSELYLKVLAPGVSIAACFGSLSVLEQGVESGGGIGLDDAGKVLKELEVFVERQVWGIVEHGDSVIGVADVGGNFALADIVLVLAVLNFDRGVVGFDDAGFEQLLFLQVVQQGKRIGGGLHPVALSRARDCHVLPCKDLLLSIVGKSIIELTDDNLTQEAWTGVAARDGRARLFCRDDVLLAFRASAGFLVVVDHLQAGTDHLKLLSNEIANENSHDFAIRAERTLGFDAMVDRLVREIFHIFENVFDAGRLVIVMGGRLLGLVRRLSDSRARIVLLSLLAVVALIAFLGLCNQDIELGLKVAEYFALLVIPFECLFELFLKVFDKRSQALNLGPWVRELLFELFDFVFHSAPYAVSTNK